MFASPSDPQPSDSNDANDPPAAGETGRETTALSILFADVVGSTRLYDTLGDDIAQQLIADAIELMAEQVGRNSGTVIKTIGDEIMATFPTAENAINAAMGLHESIQGELPGKNANTPAGFSLRVGTHHGPAILEDNDVFGDAVNVAARMSQVAKGSQIIATQASVESLSPYLRACTRHIDTAPVKGKAEALHIFEVVWQPENVTIVGPALPTASATRLILEYGDQKTELPASGGRLVLGRGQQADVIVDDTMVSREHAHIECRRGRFYLVDRSTNGTHVQTPAGAYYLRRNDISIEGKGRISLGRELEEATHVVTYETE